MKLLRYRLVKFLSLPFMIAITASLFLHLIFLSRVSFASFSDVFVHVLTPMRITLVSNHSTMPAKSPAFKPQISSRRMISPKNKNNIVTSPSLPIAPHHAEKNTESFLAASSPLPLVNPSAEFVLPPPALPINEVREAPIGAESYYFSQKNEADTETTFAFEQHPQKVHIEFEVRRLGIGSGKAFFDYQQLSDNRYIIKSELTATGVAALFFSGKRTEISEGEITPYGLKPSLYQFTISNKPNKTQMAEFNWVDKKLTLKNNQQTTIVDLPDNTQDFLSLFFQFMFVPPLNLTEYNLTNGKMLKAYQYQFMGEETLTTSVGSFQTIHLSKSSGEGNDKAEFWLLNNKHYLPAKILKIDNKGEGFELIIQKIDLEPNNPQLS